MRKLYIWKNQKEKESKRRTKKKSRSFVHLVCENKDCLDKGPFDVGGEYISSLSLLLVSGRGGGRRRRKGGSCASAKEEGARKIRKIRREPWRVREGKERKVKGGKSSLKRFGKGKQSICHLYRR